MRKILLSLLLLVASFAHAIEYQRIQLVNITPILWLKADGTVATTDGKVDTWSDASGNGYNVTGTLTARPYLSRSDNLENLLLQSDNLQTSWTVASATINDATHFTPTGQDGVAYQNVTTAGKQSYVYCATIASTSASRGLRFTHTDSATANYTSITATSTPTQFCSTVLGKTGGGVVTFGLADHAASGWERLTFTNVQVRSSSADATYLPTTTTPQFRGLNNKPVIHFDGVNDVLDRAFTANLDLGTTPVSLFTVVRPSFITAGTNFHILNATEVYQTKGALWRLQGSDLKLAFRTSQAGTATEVISTTAVTALMPIVLSTVYDGTTATHYFNNVANGSGAVTAAVSSTPGVFSVSKAGTQPFVGDVAELIVFNRAVTDAERTDIYNYLNYKWIP